MVLDTHHEESLDKINYLENLDKYGRREIEEHGPDMAPMFVVPLEADMGEVSTSTTSAESAEIIIVSALG